MFPHQYGKHILILFLTVCRVGSIVKQLWMICYCLHQARRAHMDKLEDLLKALRKNSLKISPKKCQLFRTELQYMGNTIFIKERRVCVKPLHSRLEVIQKVKAPTTAKQCKSFVGMVNFVSIFCPELQRLLKPIYDLMRKDRQFVWGKEQQDAFEENKTKVAENLQYYICQIK